MYVYTYIYIYYICIYTYIYMYIYLKICICHTIKFALLPMKVFLYKILIFNEEDGFDDAY